MSRRLVVVPSTLFSPRTVEAVPSNRAALERLRSELEVSVYTWPYMDGGPQVSATWQGEVTALRELLAEDCHVLSFGGTAALAIVAISGCKSVRSLTCDGMFPPPATLRRLGQHSAAEAAEVTIRASRIGLSQYVRYLLPQGSAGEISQFIELMDRDIDWAREQEHANSYASLDLVQENVLVEVPALCLQLPIAIAGYDEDGAILKRFVPRVAVEPFEPWGFNDSAGGARLAERVLRFVGEVEQERSQAGQAG
ncbi:MAG TPA: hypothetical protein VFO84_06435 [Dehalococcoidia bacterium]|nr:hypothetical protein [Dehalococcoidia bacterium]